MFSTEQFEHSVEGWNSFGEKTEGSPIWRWRLKPARGQQWTKCCSGIIRFTPSIRRRQSVTVNAKHPVAPRPITLTADALRVDGHGWKALQPADDRPIRNTAYIDLGRVQPVSAHTGYLKIAKPTVKEATHTLFEQSTLSRLFDIMGKAYSTGKMAITDVDAERSVPVVKIGGKDISGFHWALANSQ